MIKTILVGLGNVGAEYDLYECKYKRSHLGALLKQKKIKLVKLVDKNKKKISNIKKKIHLSDVSYSNSIVNSEKIKLDLAIVATSTESHEKNIMEILKYKPKLLVCEKPLTSHPDRDKRVLNTLQKKNVKLIINYHRKFDSRFRQLNLLIKNNSYNKLIFKYGNGFLNYASHMLDFLIRTLGKIKNLKIIRKEKFKKDFSIDLYVKFECGFKAYFLSFENYQFDIFDLEIYNKKNKIEVVYGGHEINFFQTKKNLIYKNYSFLKQKKRKFESFGNGFEQLYENITKYFEGKNNLIDQENDYFYFSSIIKKIIG